MTPYAQQLITQIRSEVAAALATLRQDHQSPWQTNKGRELGKYFMPRSMSMVAVDDAGAVQLKRTKTYSFLEDEENLVTQ